MKLSKAIEGYEIASISEGYSLSPIASYAPLFRAKFRQIEKGSPLGNPSMLHKSSSLQIKLWRIVIENKIKHIRAIRAEDATRTGTSLIHPEGCHARNDIAVAQEVGPAGIAITGSTGRVIIGKP